MLLVTTALEETWGEEGKLILLGEWCRLYSRKEILSKRSYSIATYHWDDRQKAYNDSKYLQSLNKKIIHELTPILNNLHDADYSDRSWNLLIGCWLVEFTAVIFDRWTMIDNVRKEYECLETIVINHGQNTVPKDIYEALYFFLDDSWNHEIYSKIISRLGDIKVKKKNKRKVTIDPYRSSVRRAIVTNKSKLRLSTELLIKKFILRVFNYLSRNNTYIFATSGINKLDIFKLQILLKQIPGHVEFPDVPDILFNSRFRQWQLPCINHDKTFENIVRDLIPQYLPKVYLEGFDDCNKLIDKINISKTPEIIFTDTGHFLSDLFKLWTMRYLDKGVKLVTAQHGGGAFYRYSGAMFFDISIPDIYISTGYNNVSSKNTKPVGQLFNRVKYRNYNPNSCCALLITSAMPRYSFDLRSMPIAGQVLDYFNEQYKFFKSLPKEIQGQIRIRLHPNDQEWDQKQRWNDCCPEAIFDVEGRSMSQSIKKSKLAISTYSATNYNEKFSANIPTVIYWNTKHWELSDESKLLFEELKSVGIFHETPESAAAQVAKIWNDVDKWWGQEALQEVIERYCRAYAYKPNNLLTRLKDVLLEAAEK